MNWVFCSLVTRSCRRSVLGDCVRAVPTPDLCAAQLIVDFCGRPTEALLLNFKQWEVLELAPCFVGLVGFKFLCFSCLCLLSVELQVTVCLCFMLPEENVWYLSLPFSGGTAMSHSQVSQSLFSISLPWMRE